MADALSDLVTLTNAASGLIGSLSQLQDTRIQLESNRISSEVGRLNSEFLQNMNRPLGDPNRIEMRNWRDKLDEHKAKVQARLDTISSPVVRATVDARNAEMTRGFMDGVTMKMFEQEVAKAQEDFTVEVVNEAGNTSVPLNDRIAHIESRFAEESARGLMSPKEFAALRAKSVSPLIAESLASDAVRLLDSVAAVDPSQPGVTYSEAATAVAQKPGVTSEERQMAIQILESRQKQVDAGARAAWENVFTNPAKAENVNLAEAKSVIDSDRISPEVKRGMVNDLDGYTLKIVENKMDAVFNLYMNVDFQKRIPLREEARKALNSIEFSDPRLEEKKLSMLKEVDSWKEGAEDRDRLVKLKTAEILGWEEMYRARKGDFSKDGALKLFFLLGKHTQDPDVAALAYKKRQELMDQDLGVDSTVIKAMQDGLIKDSVRAVVNNATMRVPPEAKKMITGADKTGKDKDLQAQARVDQIEYDLAIDLKNYIQNSKSKLFDEDAKKYLDKKIYERLTTVPFADKVPQTGWLEKMPEKDVAGYAAKTLSSGGAFNGAAPVKGTEAFYEAYREVAGTKMERIVGKDWSDKYSFSDSVAGRQKGEVSFIDKTDRNKRIDVKSDGKSILLYDMVKQGDKWVFVKVRQEPKSPGQSQNVLGDSFDIEAAKKAYSSGRGGNATK